MKLQINPCDVCGELWIKYWIKTLTKEIITQVPVVDELEIKEIKLNVQHSLSAICQNTI